MQMINAYRVRGHLIADLDPLGCEPQLPPRARSRDVRPDHLGPRPRIPHRQPRRVIGEGGPSRRHAARDPRDPARDLLRQDRRRVHEHPGAGAEALAAAAHGAGRPTAGRSTARRALRILRKLIAAEEFEHFLHSRFVGQKRFALEGARDGHRHAGRDPRARRRSRTCTRSSSAWPTAAASTSSPTWSAKTSSRSSREFEGEIDPASTQGSGDVKYHLGATRHAPDWTTAARSSSPSRPTRATWKRWIPVVEGIVRPKQDRLGDTGARTRHPGADPRRRGLRRPGRGRRDAEPLAAGRLPHRRHHPRHHQQPDRLHHPARRVALHAVLAPTWRAASRRPSSTSTATIRRRWSAWPRLAFDYRQQFKNDVVIDMICYRRHGHNEGDDPSYTQPLHVRKIKSHPSVAQLYARAAGARRA